MDEQRAYQILRNFVDGIIPTRYRKIVERWLICNKDYNIKDKALKRIWNESEGKTDSSLQYSLDYFRQNRADFSAEIHRSTLIKHIIRYAAILIIPILIGTATWWILSNHHGQSNDMIECYVPNGKIKSIELSDGTTVVANSGTTVLYPKKFNGNIRQIYLIGEAYFKVAKETDHPFIVNTGQLNIQVLGTHFNVKAYSDDDLVTTTLEKGAVELYDNEKKSALCILKPNEQAVYDRRTRHYTKSVVEALNYSSWVKGNLDFNKQSINQIIPILEHRFDVKFLVDHTLNMDKEYTMNFKSYENLDDILRVLVTLSGNMSYKKEGRIIKLYQSRKEVANR